MQRKKMNIQKNTRKLYTVKDICDIFSCCKNKAYAIIHSSGFPKMKIGRDYYIVPAKFESWLNANHNKGIEIDSANKWKNK